jgi:hypothetical protein
MTTNLGIRRGSLQFHWGTGTAPALALEPILILEAQLTTRPTEAPLTEGEVAAELLHVIVQFTGAAKLRSFELLFRSEDEGILLRGVLALLGEATREPPSETYSGRMTVSHFS